MNKVVEWSFFIFWAYFNCSCSLSTRRFGSTLKIKWNTLSYLRWNREKALNNDTSLFKFTIVELVILDTLHLLRCMNTYCFCDLFYHISIGSKLVSDRFLCIVLFKMVCLNMFSIFSNYIRIKRITNEVNYKNNGIKNYLLKIIVAHFSKKNKIFQIFDFKHVSNCLIKAKRHESFFEQFIN